MKLAMISFWQVLRDLLHEKKVVASSSEIEIGAKVALLCQKASAPSHCNRKVVDKLVHLKRFFNFAVVGGARGYLEGSH